MIRLLDWTVSLPRPQCTRDAVTVTQRYRRVFREWSRGLASWTHASPTAHPLREAEVSWSLARVRSQAPRAHADDPRLPRLGLDDRVDRWWPPILQVNPANMIRQLLNYTSGVFDITDSPGYRDSMLADPASIGPPRAPSACWARCSSRPDKHGATPTPTTCWLA